MAVSLVILSINSKFKMGIFLNRRIHRKFNKQQVGPTSESNSILNGILIDRLKFDIHNFEPYFFWKILCTKIMVKNLLGEQNFNVKKMSSEDKFWMKKILVQKIVFVKKCWVKKKSVQKYVRSKTLLSYKIVSLKQDFG